MPVTVPMSRTRAQSFDEMVLESVEAIERFVDDGDRFPGSRLRGVEFAVEDVPGEVNAYDTDVLEDRQVPLARLLPAQPGTGGPQPRIVVYRRPLELRAHGAEELASLVRSVIVEQVANLLGVDPGEIDPDAD
ncbi:zinicin-like metallopeptidase [Stackebrandtia albiflava]|uniref:Zinicin-like metallopeptidase n=2 Tax=Stackebrandtia albiflava TaxID=406432 RepID=A0A562URS4_9ACTN|nr:zinicin-like metallopeptidase [Stackebrandtia albiflava]